MNLKDKRLGFQVTALMLLIALAAGVVGAIGIYGMSQMHDASDQVYQQDVVPMNILSQMRFDAEAYMSNVVFAVSARNPQEQQSFLLQVDQKKDAMNVHIGKFEAISRSAEEELAWKQFKTLWNNDVVSSQMTLQNAEEGRMAESLANMFGDAETKNQQVGDMLQKMVDSKLDKVNRDSMDKMALIFQKASLISIILIAIDVLVSIVIGWLLGRALSKMMQQLLQNANEIAAGDIARKKKAPWKQWNREGAELQKAFGDMVVSLRDIMTNVTAMAGQLSQTAQEMRLGADRC